MSVAVTGLSSICPNFHGSSLSNHGFFLIQFMCNSEPGAGGESWTRSRTGTGPMTGFAALRAVRLCLTGTHLHYIRGSASASPRGAQPQQNRLVLGEAEPYR